MPENGKRNSCRCCNQRNKKVTNIIENIEENIEENMQEPEPDQKIKYDDCSYNGHNYGLCDNSSGCFMTTISNEQVCCKDWTKNKGCNDATLLCGNEKSVTLKGCSNKITVGPCSSIKKRTLELRLIIILLAYLRFFPTTV